MFFFKSAKPGILVKTNNLFRSSRSQMFFKIRALKNFTIFTGKHTSESFFTDHVK